MLLNHIADKPLTVFGITWKSDNLPIASAEEARVTPGPFSLGLDAAIQAGQGASALENNRLWPGATIEP
ncbi:hypothetical protein LCGC14_1369530 [marine sediment metagenome]|uniref:Uncharacterized protein n=1 Tax=marine sediment metagenome TaxID=412755 RepID=A0A0F9MKY7_9ZZZZ